MVAGILAWLGMCTGVLALLSYADKAASAEGKLRARALLDFGWKDTVTHWPSVFVEMFDSVFGKKHFTWKCFGRSCIASVTALCLFSLVFAWVRPEYASVSLVRQGRVIGVNWGLLIFPVLFDILPDYVSLVETRLILSLLRNQRRRWSAVCVAIVGDFVLTFVVFCASAIIALSIVGFLPSDMGWWEVKRLAYLIACGFLFDNPDKLPGLGFGVFLWSTYFTSIWIWLYALATFAGKLLRPVLNRIEKFKALVDLDNKPFLALRWLSVLIITVLFAVVAVVKACV